MYILISHFTWRLQWFIMLDINNLINVSHHYWMLLKLSIKWNQHEYQNGGFSFQTKEVQQGIPRNLGTNPDMSTYVETLRYGKFFSRENTPEELTWTHKSFFFFIKTSKWEKWWSWWLRITNAFILCNLLWKVQKNLAANREGSFNQYLQTSL